MKKNNQQSDFFSKKSQSYGGILLRKTKNRQYARPISTTKSMHLVLRSSKATNEQSFKTGENRKKIDAIIKKFSLKYGVQVISLANVGNHLHFHVRITKRIGYVRFIRAITAAIAMAVTGRNRWKKQSENKEKFWDYRPFTRIVQGLRDYLGLQDYVQINQLEGLGVPRLQIPLIIQRVRPLLC